MTMNRTGGFERCGVCGREMTAEESVRRVEAGVPAISPFVGHTDVGLRGHAECFIATGLAHVGDGPDTERADQYRAALEKYLGAPLVIRDESPKQDGRKVCVVCRNPLLVETEKVYRGDPMMAIMGPGSANQLSAETTTSCGTCGLLYVNGGGVDPDKGA